MGAPADRRATLAFVERFRHWHEYEKGCNRKTLLMPKSVAQSARESPSFVRAMGKMAHLVAARRMWLHRMGVVADQPETWFPPNSVEQLPALVSSIESRWIACLASLTDADIAGQLTCAGGDGKRCRRRLLGLLTQVFGHARHHRGQVAMLAGDLGGQTVDIDRIFWDRPSVRGDEA